MFTTTLNRKRSHARRRWRDISFPWERMRKHILNKHPSKKIDAIAKRFTEAQRLIIQNITRPKGIELSLVSGQVTLIRPARDWLHCNWLIHTFGESILQSSCVISNYPYFTSKTSKKQRFFLKALQKLEDNYYSGPPK